MQSFSPPFQTFSLEPALQNRIATLSRFKSNNPTQQPYHKQTRRDEQGNLLGILLEKSAKSRAAIEITAQSLAKK
jgi:hypothetical protein